jgi:two-component system LytT family sensor kinase
MQTVTFLKNIISGKHSIPIGWNLLFIAFFIFYENLLVLVVKPEALESLSLLYYLPAIGIFYMNTFVIMKLWAKKFSRLLIVLCLTISEVILYSAISLCIASFIQKLDINDSQIYNTQSMARTFWRGIYFWGFSLMYWFHLQNIKNIRRADTLALENAEAELEKVKLENKLLRSQINPHFLCNTLNSIYAMAEGHDEQIARAIKLTSDFVRYTYTDHTQDNVQLVPVKDEMEQVNGLLEICSIRFGKLPIQLDINMEKDSDFRIPPVLLLTFVENIFAHGVYKDPSHPVLISVSLTRSEFRFRVRNRKQDFPVHRSSGIGIENANARLAVCYPGRFQFDTYNTENYYSLDLKITS